MWFLGYYRRNPEAGAIFNEAMRLIGKHNSAEIARAFDWSQFPVIADIGGGFGSLLVDILDAYPSCRAILYDQPSVVDAFDCKHDAPEAQRVRRCESRRARAGGSCASGFTGIS